MTDTTPLFPVGAYRPEADAPTLEVRDGAGALSRFSIDRPTVIVGRSADAHVRLEHGMVSRHHAQFTREDDGRLTVRDLGSRNGTLVNGLPAPEPRPVGPGDRVVIGPFTLTIHFQSPERPPHRTTRIPVADLATGRISTFGELSLPRVSAAQLTVLMDLGQDLLSVPDPRDRMAATCRLLTGPQIQATWAAVVRLPDPPVGDDHEILCQCQSPGRGANSFHLGETQPYLSRSVLRALRDKREPILAGDTITPTDVQMSMAAQSLPTATIACPLSGSAGHFDLIYLTLPPQFGSGEWLALAALAARQYQQAEASWAARRKAEEHVVLERDLINARRIQTRLIPNDPQIAGLDVAIGFSPCRSVGGDYVDVVPTADGRTLLAVADVCGKGLGAALVAQGLHTAVRTSLLAGLSLRQLMINTNHYLRLTLPTESFATCIAVLLDPATGELECVNAGHPRPLVISPGQPPRELIGESGLPLGIDYEGELEIFTSTHRLEPGELLALYTDGLSELTLPGGDLLGPEALHGEIAGLYTDHQTPARDVAAQLTRRLNDLMAGQPASDDRTFLLARRV